MNQITDGVHWCLHWVTQLIVDHCLSRCLIVWNFATSMWDWMRHRCIVLVIIYNRQSVSFKCLSLIIIFFIFILATVLFAGKSNRERGLHQSVWIHLFSLADFQVRRFLSLCQLFLFWHAFLRCWEKLVAIQCCYKSKIQNNRRKSIHNCSVMCNLAHLHHPF